MEQEDPEIQDVRDREFRAANVLSYSSGPLELLQLRRFPEPGARLMRSLAHGRPPHDHGAGGSPVFDV